MSNSWLINIVRYLLAFVMIIYGWVKIIGIQFEMPEDVRNMALKDLDGITISFAFLGYSKWVSIASGVLEFGCAVLLLFRKTYLIGALMLLPVLAYVLLVNIGYDFTMFMRIWTGGLLFLDLILLVSNRATLSKIYRLTVDHTQNSKPTRFEIIVNVIIVLLIVVGFSMLIPLIKQSV